MSIQDYAEGVADGNAQMIEENDRLRDELEQVKRERDEARKVILQAHDLTSIARLQYPKQGDLYTAMIKIEQLTWLALNRPEHAREALEPCTWTQDADDGFWYTECGNAYEFMEDGPEENNHTFCPYCGGRLAF